MDPSPLCNMRATQSRPIEISDFTRLQAVVSPCQERSVALREAGTIHWTNPRAVGSWSPERQIGMLACMLGQLGARSIHKRLPSRVDKTNGGAMSEVEADLQLRQLIDAAVVARSVADVASMGVADALGERSESSDVLAQRVGAHPDALRRVLRLLAAHGVFLEESAGRFAHTDQSRLLRSNHPRSLRAVFRGLGDMAWKIFGALSSTLRTGQPATSALAPGGFFEYLASHPDEARIFDEIMTSKAHADISALMPAYDFSKFKLIVDVGGGRGHLVKAILAAAPNSSGVLFDLPHAVGHVPVLPSERLTVQAGDFFKDALPRGDAYLLMNVIHDWPDSEAINILKAVRREAQRDTKLLVIEVVVPDQIEPDSREARRALNLDVVMLAWSGGRERTASEYGALVRQGGFRLDRVISTRSDMSVIECSPA
jgi:hypothetical protein